MKKVISVILLAAALTGCEDKLKDELQPETFETEVKISKKGPEPIDSSAIIKLPIDPLVIFPERANNLLFEIGLHYETHDNRLQTLSKIELISVEAADLNERQKSEYLKTKKPPAEFWHNDNNDWSVYRVKQIYNLPDSKGAILSLYIKEYREGKSQILALFEKRNEYLVFKTFINRVYGGVNTIDTILAVSSSYLIAGTYIDGDGGDEYRHIWFDKYTLPDSAAELYRKEFAFYIEENDKKFGRTIDTTKGIFIITIYERKVLEFGHGETKYGEWNIVEVDTADYRKFF